MNEIKRRAYAKVNLILDVGGRRPDNYHELDGVMQQISLHDTLYLSKAEDGIRLSVECESTPGSGHENVPGGADNLAYRAAELIMNAAGIAGGVRIRLIKRIPAAAGLAGGSTDAAAVLSGINELYGLGLRVEELCRMGAGLGADIPFCIKGGTARTRGIGELLDELPAPPELPVLLVKPELAVSTKQVYEDYDSLPAAALKGGTEKLIAVLRDKADARGIAASLHNSLAEVTEAQHPLIAGIREDMLKEGAAGALMSGSGPTVFAIFDTKERAEAAELAMRAKYPQAFCGLYHTI